MRDDEQRPEDGLDFARGCLWGLVIMTTAALFLYMIVRLVNE